MLHNLSSVSVSLACFIIAANYAAYSVTSDITSCILVWKRISKCPPIFLQSKSVCANFCSIYFILLYMCGQLTEGD